MWAHPGKQLLFMGSEFGQPSEWSQERGLDWWILEQPAHRGVQTMVAAVNALYQQNPALWQLDHDPAGFTWIDGGNSDANVLSFLRWDTAGNPIACVINFAGSPYFDFAVGLPMAGEWTEILNTDATEFGGSGVGNFGAVQADQEGSHGQPHGAKITVPPLGVVWLKPKKSKK
jgi:1,4-alpha-glucan branching enzyme